MMEFTRQEHNVGTGPSRSSAKLAAFALLLGALACSDSGGGKHGLDRPLDVRAFIVLSDDQELFEHTLEKASRLGVGQVQLSHSVVMNVDELDQDEGKLELVGNMARQAKEDGLKVFLWAHELNNAGVAVCFDPMDKVWRDRAAVYRRVLKALPRVDGVVLMFGSSRPDPWFAACTCDYCEARKSEAEDPDLWMFQVPPPAERVAFITKVVHAVVVQELGKELIVRTFIHQPDENTWVRDGLKAVQDIDFSVMSKDVPQDWEPYYPPHPLFGEFPNRPHVMELDAAGEYWGRSVLPFCAVEYLERRFDYGRHKGFDGYAARVSRGDDAAFSTPNEVNLLASSMFAESGDTTSKQVWDRFVSERYGLDPASEAGKALESALRRTFDIGRKMYYFKGFWALEKGSGLPDTLREAKLLEERSIAKWDPDYQDWFEELSSPAVQTLVDLKQEKLEAQALANLSIQDIETACTSLSEADCNDLKSRLQHRSLCVKAWTEVAELVWGHMYYERTKNQAALGWLAASLESFEQEAEQIDSMGFGWPCEPAKMRSLASDLREALPVLTGPEKRRQVFISPPDITVSGRKVTVAFTTDPPGTAKIQWGTEVPDYGNEVTVSTQPATEHHAEFRVPRPGWYVLRIVAEAEAEGLDANRTDGSDYWFAVR